MAKQKIAFQGPSFFKVVLVTRLIKLLCLHDSIVLQISDMIKISDDKTNWTDLLARAHLVTLSLTFLVILVN